MAAGAGLSRVSAPATALLLLAAACAEREPTIIDGSSPEAFERSVTEARADLPDRDRLTYDRAIRSVQGRRFSADPDQLARETFDGMTARQVVADQKARESE